MLFQGLPYEDDTEEEEDNSDTWDDDWDSTERRTISKETEIK